MEDSRNGVKSPDELMLSWAKLDLENRIGFRGGRHTRVNGTLSFLAAMLMTAAFFATLTQFSNTYFAAMFTERGAIPYCIVFFSCWSIAILTIKWRKIAFQRRALRVRVVDDTPGEFLSPTTVDGVIKKLYEVADDPKHFVVLNRILVALSNLKNLGRVTDVDEILRSQAEHDEAAMETSYSLVRGFIWAIPVLGFIGTVLGLSAAIGSFGGVLENEADMSAVTQSLKSVTGGLATAFETTLEALVAALGIQLALTFLHKSEEEFLDESRDYCQKHIVNRLRMTPFENAD